MGSISTASRHKEVFENELKRESSARDGTSSTLNEFFVNGACPKNWATSRLVESSFDITARSSAGAMGMWQFMRATGREYMRVDRHVDERIDPIESTRAAASYLSQAHRSLGNWPLAITSYNYGQAGIARAVAQIGSDNLVDLINNYSHPYWGYAPKNFYAEFLVAVEIGKNYQQYFPGLELDTRANFREVEVRSGSSVTALARPRGSRWTSSWHGTPPSAGTRAPFQPVTR